MKQHAIKQNLTCYASKHIADCVENIADCVEVSCKGEKVYSNNRKRLCDNQSIHNMIKIVKSLWG